MSEVLHLWDEVFGICAKAGVDPNTVQNIIVTPEVVMFEVYAEPKQVGAGCPLTVMVTHPWTREPE